MLLVQPRHFFLGVLMQYLYDYEPGIITWYDSMRCSSWVQNSQEWVFVTQRRSFLISIQRNNFAQFCKQHYRITALSNGHFLLGSFFTDVTRNWEKRWFIDWRLTSGLERSLECSLLNFYQLPLLFHWHCIWKGIGIVPNSHASHLTVSKTCSLYFFAVCL